jgi:hypothetical protein
MTATPRTKGGFNLLGLGALACIGCCAAPVLAFLGGLSVAGLASTTLIGGAGFLITGLAAIAYLIVRHRRSLDCAMTHPDAVPVPAPTRRGTAIDTEEVPVP